MRKSFFPALLLCFPMVASAGEIGTYRAGVPYMTIPSQSAEQCEQQCMGDAQCKGWNFLLVRTPTSPAICEFNSRAVSPRQHPASISGENLSPYDTASLINAGPRTIRVGQIAPPMSAPRHLPTKAMSHQTTTFNAPRSQPIIQPVHPTKSTVTRRNSLATPVPGPSQTGTPPSAPTRQVNPLSFRYSLDTGPSQSAAAQVISKQTNLSPAPANTPAPRGALQPMLDGPGTMSSTMQQNNVVERNMPAQVAAPQYMPSPGLPKQSIEQAPQQDLNPRHQPADGGQPNTNIMPAPKIDPGLAGAPMKEPVSRSLYGTLYDDVRIPKTLQKDDIPLDPNAPIPTVTSVPIGQIYEGKL